MTAQEIFNRAIICMGENDDNTGATMTGDTMEYKVRAVAILNILANEAYPYSDTFEPEQNKRSVLPPIANLSDEVQMDDYICGTVLPYGLAAELMKTAECLDLCLRMLFLMGECLNEIQ